MSSSSKAVRWSKVILLGCALGVLFAFINTQLLFTPSTRLAAPFKLCDAARGNDLKRVVQSQLTAFREGNFTGAYGFADSEFKSQMSVNAFEHMVKSGFPAMTKSRSVTFGVMVDNGDQAVVNLAIAGKSGAVIHYQYLLKREGASWKISGVSRVRLDATVI